jgi:5-formyltetrahydrofolate cyclo-ligase
MDWPALKAWRRAERDRLLAMRTAAPPDERRRWSAAIAGHLESLLAERRGILLGIYWPFRAEFDPRPLLPALFAAGSRLALPAIVDKNGPLEYRAWAPGEKLIDGVWNIPVPEKRDIVTPDVVLVPLVGFDEDCYRLGYGGGYFDRTLAALEPRPLAIGVGFELSRLATIYPQPHDMPMDRVVTEAGVRRRGAPPRE